MWLLIIPQSICIPRACYRGCVVIKQVVNNQPMIFHGCQLVVYNYTASLLGNIIIMMYMYSEFPNCVYCSVFKGHHQPFKAKSKSPCKGEK